MLPLLLTKTPLYRLPKKLIGPENPSEKPVLPVVGNERSSPRPRSAVEKPASGRTALIRRRDSSGSKPERAVRPLRAVAPLRRAAALESFETCPRRTVFNPAIARLLAVLPGTRARRLLPSPARGRCSDAPEGNIRFAAFCDRDAKSRGTCPRGRSFARK